MLAIIVVIIIIIIAVIIIFFFSMGMFSGININRCDRENCIDATQNGAR